MEIGFSYDIPELWRTPAPPLIIRGLLRKAEGYMITSSSPGLSPCKGPPDAHERCLPCLGSFYNASRQPKHPMLLWFPLQSALHHLLLITHAIRLLGGAFGYCRPALVLEAGHTVEAVTRPYHERVRRNAHFYTPAACRGETLSSVASHRVGTRSKN
jgi:hypothetical protein